MLTSLKVIGIISPKLYIKWPGLIIKPEALMNISTADHGLLQLLPGRVSICRLWISSSQAPWPLELAELIASC